MIAAGAQWLGIMITIVVALVLGLLSGKIISFFGKRKEAYADVAEFVDAE